MASRRWEQLVSPQVWDEEGQVISGFIHHGWGEFLRPVNGYLILIPQIIVGASLAISVYSYPLVSTILTWLFIASVGLAVATAPTRLKGKFFCAIAIIAIPSDPEVFGVTLYTFWWASILALLLPLWDEQRPALGLRLAFLAAGGLSSPVIAIVLPILYFRAFWYRAFPAEKVLAVAGTAIAGIQLHFIAAGAAARGSSLTSILENAVPKFCGWFLAGSISENFGLLWPAGIVVVGLIGASCLWDRRNSAPWVLLTLWAGAVALSVARIDPAGLDPRWAGPRYFFFPYILTFWILGQFYLTAAAGWLRGVVGVVIGCALLNAGPGWSRKHDNLQWADQLRSAPQFPDYAIPIEGDGSRFRAWSIEESRSAWTGLIRRAWLDSYEKPENWPTFAYRVLDARDHEGKEASLAVIKQSKDSALDQRIDLGYGRAIALAAAPGSGHREFILDLRRGDRLRYLSGPKNGGQSMKVAGFEKAFIGSLPVTKERGWFWLEFSNSTLPDEFTLKIEDDGEGPGFWSALGVDRAGDVCVGLNRSGSLDIGVPLTVQPGIVTQPFNEISAAGSTVVLTVVGTEISSYQWKRGGLELADGTDDGATIAGSTQPQLTLSHLKPAAAGSYVCVLTNPLGSVATHPANLSIASEPHPSPPAIFSFRGFVGTGASPMTVQFHIAGITSRTVLIHAIGPGQRTNEFLAETSLQLSNSIGPIYTNTGWKTAGNRALLQAASRSVFADTDLAAGDSALLVTLPPGIYSAVISGVDGATGVATMEVYELP